MTDNSTTNIDGDAAQRVCLASRGAIIKGILKAMGISLTDFAREMEVNASFLSRVLNAFEKLTIEVIEFHLDRAEGLLRERKVSILNGPEEIGILIPKRELNPSVEDHDDSVVSSPDNGPEDGNWQGG